jgi:hypothetical protein
MVKTTTYYTCGCGFNSESAEQAEDHVKATGHKLDIRGMMVP